MLSILGVIALSCVVSFLAVNGWTPVMADMSRGRFLGKDTIDIGGRRFFTAAFAPDRFDAGGAYQPVRLQAVGYSVRIEGDARPAGLYLTFSGERDVPVAVTVRGHTLQGAPMIGVSGQRLIRDDQNLLRGASDISDTHAWSGAADVTATDDGIGRIRFRPGRSYWYQTTETAARAGNAYRLSIKARLISGDPSVVMFVNRAGGDDAQSRNIVLTRAWQYYTLRHPGAWTGATGVQFGLEGGSTEFEIQAPRLVPAVEGSSGSFPSPASPLDSSAKDAAGPAPDGSATFVIKDADLVGVSIYGTSAFSYRLDRICVDPVARTDDAPARGRDCALITTAP